MIECCIYMSCFYISNINKNELSTKVTNSTIYKKKIYYIMDKPPNILSNVCEEIRSAVKYQLRHFTEDIIELVFNLRRIFFSNNLQISFNK